MTIMTGNPFHCTATLKLAPDLEPIDYDPWAELEFKSKLTGLKMKEKQALEESNMAVIERVYQRLREDKGVQGRIRGCGWWKENDNSIQSTYGARQGCIRVRPATGLSRWWRNDDAE